MNTPDDEMSDLLDITIDTGFIANALTASMHLNGDLEDNEYLTIEYLETEGTYFNIVAKRNYLIVN